MSLEYLTSNGRGRHRRIEQNNHDPVPETLFKMNLEQLNAGQPHTYARGENTLSPEEQYRILAGMD